MNKILRYKVNNYSIKTYFKLIICVTTCSIPTLLLWYGLTTTMYWK